MVPERVRENFKATRPFGCLFATVLGLSMGFVVFVGSVIGDCEPGAGCHDNDGLRILQGLLVALPIVCLLAAGAWLISTVLQAALGRILPQPVLSILLVAVTLALVWYCFDPAFEVFFWWTGTG